MSEPQVPPTGNELILFEQTPPKHYFILSFPYYYTFVFYGTEVEAKELFLHKCEWEGTGTMRKADPKIKQDADLVREEIVNVRIDRANGIKGLPYLPGKGWL